MDHIGLIAGNGSFPLLCAKAARLKHIRVTAIALREETDPALEDMVDTIHWIGVGELNRLLELLKGSALTHVMLAGQVKPKHLFESAGSFDATMSGLLGSLQDKKADSIFQALCQCLQSVGLTIIDSTLLLAEDMARPGVLAGREPTDEEWANIRFGFKIAQEVARLDIGLTVVVKDCAIVAVEALEGTDAAITRGGEIAHEGITVVKVARPAQDMRIDIPVVGLSTIQTCAAAGGRVLAIEAHKTLILDKEAFFSQAVEAGITVIGITPDKA